MLYRDFIQILSDRLSSSLESIEVEHNFEFGVEFENVLCKTLRSALPDRYGVVRGYAVDAGGTVAGDDILIFARERFPTLALRDRDDFARKEFVPIEATYCYIEAKHTVLVQGSGPQSLRHACDQVGQVKELCSRRPPVESGQISQYCNIGKGLSVTLPPDFPSIFNPSFGVVFARHIRASSNSGPCASGQEVARLLDGFSIDVPHPPDLLVLGDSVLILPCVPAGDGGRQYRSPFYVDGLSHYSLNVIDNRAFGIGLASILAALDWIQLGVLPWHKIIGDALGIPP